MDSQRHSSQDSQRAATEEEWQIVPTHWWRTPFSSISWSYDPEKSSQGLVFAKPPHYHRSLYRKPAWELPDEEESGEEILRTPSEWRPSVRCRIAGEDDVLNEDLVGVKGASDALSIYEAAVGFESSTWPDLEPERSKRRESLHIHVSQMDIELGRERWNELVEDLVGGKTLENLLKGEKPSTQHPSVSQVVLFNSDYFSRPLTPKNFRLNPSASSFVPLGSPTSTSSFSSSSSSSDSSDRFVAFAFPSLNNFPPPASSGNDHRSGTPGIPSHSRTTSNASNPGVGCDRPSASVLPPFLLDSSNQRRRPNRTSRTRAIVDQLRSRHHQDTVRSLPPSQGSSPTLPEFGIGNLSLRAPGLTVSEDGAIARSNMCSSSPPLEEDYECFEQGSGELHGAAGGWTLPPTPNAVDPETKKNRSRELFMALRRRTDSLSSSAYTAASLPVLGSTLSGDVAASAPSVISDSGRLIGSPEPVSILATDKPIAPREDAECDYVRDTGVDSTHFLLPGASIHNLSPTNSSCSSPIAPSDASFCRSPIHTRAHAHITSRVHPPCDTQLQNHTYTHPRTKPTPSGGTKFSSADWFPNPATAGPYTFHRLPLPVSSIPLNVPIPVSVPTIPLPMAINPGAIPMPVQIPVQTMQYSTLMHLRIMQQVQMMQNSMGNIGVGPGTGVGNTARMRPRTPSHTGVIR